MRRLVAAALLLFALGGCGGGDTSPESVVRAWSEAVNRHDDEAAAGLFAPGALVTSGPVAFKLSTHEAAVRMHAALPCTSKLVETVSEGDTVIANFRLDERSFSGMCGGRGLLEAAIFTVEDDRIVAWEVLGRPGAVVADLVDAVWRGENARAGHYFAPGAVVIDGNRRLTLRSLSEAIDYSTSLACAADIVRAVTVGREVTVTLRLRQRLDPVGAAGCTRIGEIERVVATFGVGRIRIWRVL